MVRGSLAILTLLLAYFRDSLGLNMIDAMFAVGVITAATFFIFAWYQRKLCQRFKLY